MIEEIIAYFRENFGYYLNNRVLLSKALSFDRLPEEIWCSQEILGREHSSRAYMKFEHQIPEGTYHT